MAKMKKEKNMGHDMHSCLNKKVNCLSKNFIYFFC